MEYFCGLMVLDISGFGASQNIGVLMVSYFSGLPESRADGVRICLTSKMSETDTWRRACVSTTCDKYPASLHRFVRLRFDCLVSRADGVRIQRRLSAIVELAVARRGSILVTPHTQ